MVLAAGRGRRLEPLSGFLPKPAMPLPDGPLISWALQLAGRLTKRVVVNSWWLAEKMESTAQKACPPGVSLEFSREEEQMETAGGLALARDRGLLGFDGPVLVVNGDGILNLDLKPLVTAHMERGAEVSLALLPHLDCSRWSRVLLDAEGLVERISGPGAPGPGEVPLLYPGVMLISRRALNSLECRPSGVADTLWKEAREHGRMRGVIVQGHWREIGTPEDYLHAVLRRISGRVYCHPKATISRSAKLENVLIGSGCEVSEDAEIRDSALSHGVIVGRGAVIRSSVLLGPVELQAGAVLDGEVRSGGAVQPEGVPLS